MNSALKQLLRPGDSIVVVGDKGQGKTAKLLAFAHFFIHEMGGVVLSNLIFMECVGKDAAGNPVFSEDPVVPGGFRFVDNFADLFREIGNALSEDINRPVAWLVDEAALGAASAYVSVFTRVSQSLATFLTLQRKWNVLSFFVTIDDSLLRGVLRTDEKNFLRAKVDCSKNRLRQIATLRGRVGKDSDGWKRFAVISWSEQEVSDWVVEFRLNDCPWTKPEEQCEPGDIVFDTRGASSGFHLGELNGRPFNMDALMVQLGKKTRFGVPRAIREFFEQGQSEGSIVGKQPQESERGVSGNTAQPALAEELAVEAPNGPHRLMGFVYREGKLYPTEQALRIRNLKSTMSAREIADQEGIGRSTVYKIIDNLRRFGA